MEGEKVVVGGGDLGLVSWVVGEKRAQWPAESSEDWRNCEGFFGWRGNSI